MRTPVDQAIWLSSCIFGSLKEEFGDKLDVEGFFVPYMESSKTGGGMFELDPPTEIGAVLAGQPLHVLLVDDSAADALMIGGLLKRSNYPVKVRTVSDGEAAIDFLMRRGPYSNESLPDVVILDINLPRKSGFEVLTEIRTRPELKKLPIFMLTGSRNEEDVKRSHALDVASFITKPHHLEELEEVIKKFVTIEVPRVLKSRR